METVRLVVCVPRAVAIAGGVATYGEMEFPLKDAELSELSEEDRATLATVNIPFLRLSSHRVTWDAVASALREELADIRRRQANEAQREEAKYAAREERILEWLARPDEEWVTRRGACCRRDWCSCAVEAYLDDVRVRERLPAARALAARKNEEADERRRRRNEEVESAKEREAFEKDLVRAEFRAFALGVDALSRAASENYEVLSGVMAFVTEQISALDPVRADVLIAGTNDYHDADLLSEEDSPNAEAFGLLDRVVEHVRGVRHPASVIIEVSRVMHFTSATQAYGEDRGYPAVIVHVSSPISPARAVVFQAGE